MMMMFSGVGKVIARIHFHPGTHFTVLLRLTYFLPLVKQFSFNESQIWFLQKLKFQRFFITGGISPEKRN
jgi:hypothetical protein